MLEVRHPRPSLSSGARKLSLPPSLIPFSLLFLTSAYTDLSPGLVWSGLEPLQESPHVICASLGNGRICVDAGGSACGRFAGVVLVKGESC